MKFLLDTVALIRHFSCEGRIGKKASLILENIEQSNDSLIISVVSLMEILYLSEKNRIPIDLNDTLIKINASAKYTIINLSPEVLKVASITKFYELHDRLIVSTAKWLNIAIISSDKRFEEI
ncbi:twitching motility protein PilT, partial [Candidatus Magnetomorum sp. HK-1]